MPSAQEKFIIIVNTPFTPLLVLCVLQRPFFKVPVLSEGS